MIGRLILFLLLNFGALAVGGFFTGEGVLSDWYQNINKAPWTPPGWVFGFAWTSIMICFSIYMAYAWKTFTNKKIVLAAFVVQWLLNVGWNPIFFKFHMVFVGLLVIITLTVVIAFFLFRFYNKMKNKSFLLLPYFIWLLIATSLNAFIMLKN